jgi:hypothetical protein
MPMRGTMPRRPRLVWTMDPESASGRSTVMPVVLRKYLQQSSIKAPEHDEMALVRTPLASAGSAPEHLFEKDARLNSAQEDDELEVWDVDAGKQQVHGQCDGGLRTVAEFPDALQWPVNLPGDLRDERVTLALFVSPDHFMQRSRSMESGYLARAAATRAAGTGTILMRSVFVESMKRSG